ncbi:ATP-dependent helicase HrpB [Oceanicella actignis]|uniref:ATP-dependent helicase HrpB n=1 Tax=Oceanicella actignis TaxID=1189325 RepID=A0A1M7T9X5_9RHOB|nr:ATP-dependent helicase HrpB [Oceanicella actignis]SET51603.1 ATP-dependent helicase HrpB [Oceanicella actignis]SHN67522.1 ATP-dependent helicase HrpB [Oceanicella actignis]
MTPLAHDIARLPDLPARAALPALLDALREGSRAVFEAPPGAGKTTLVPPALLGQPWALGRIVMLQPRRVAARAAAERIAALLGEAPGARVGWRIRGETRIGPDCRIEVVTEGILTRMLQDDPEMSGVSAIIFDEIHERSLNADLGLALALEAQEALREDLRIITMSATLEGARLAQAMGGAARIRAEGRMFPVETRWLERPWRRPDRRGPRFEEAAAELILRALSEERGSALVFLPGAAEIARVERLLAPRLPADALVRPLHGAMPFARQRAALEPAPEGRRKVVLATSVAETSLTIEGVRIVVDAGRARRARFDPASGMSRLVTEPVSRAEAEQRRGRAGRLEPGVCYRMWTRGEEGALPAQPPAEILEADLTALALELALWGAEPEQLRFIDQPPAPALAEARALLRALEALDAEGRPTEHGRRLARLPAHPRLGHMILRAAEAGEDAEAAAELAALLEERDPLPPGAPCDLTLRIEALRGARDHGADPARLNAPRQAARRLMRAAGLRAGARPSAGRRPAPEPHAVGRLAARAYPDRVAMRRPPPPGGAAPGAPVRHLMVSGKGAALPADDSLAAAPFLAVADADGDPREARIRRAAPLTRADIEELFADRIEERRICAWSPRERAVRARIRRMLGAVALDDRRWSDAPPEALAAAMAEGVRQLGLQALPWSAAARRLRARVRYAAAAGAALPDWSDEGLLATLDDWLTPHLQGLRRAEDLQRLDLARVLEQALDWNAREALERLAPAHFVTPAGTRAPIDYDREPPAIAVRLQELFGLDAHPSVGGGRVRLTVDLLSPAGRPVQTTGDLPGFWRSSYADVRKDMRGRYPRHPWPEDPLSAPPTRRAKPRGSG